VAGDGVQMVVTPSHLTRLVAAGSVRVHRHGSGIYRGRYLALRHSAGRREILATGKPEPLAAKLASMGIALKEESGQWKISI
jgi:hypothetical protein